MSENNPKKNIQLSVLLSKDAFDSLYFKEICNFIGGLYDEQLFNVHKKEITLKNDIRKIEHALRFADVLSHSSVEVHRSCAFDIISKIASFHSNDPYFKIVGTAVINRLGVYAAENLISKGVQLPLDREIDSVIKKSVQKTEADGIYFTDRQYELYQSLTKAETLSFAGPTSMGKSFVINAYIKKIVSNNLNKNIVLVVPTRALISQNSLKLKSELKDMIYFKKYEIITTSYMLRDSNKNNGFIFILTPERLVSLISTVPEISIDYLFVDEAQKLTTKNDTRSLVTYSAIEQSLNSNPNIKLFFSSPNLSNPDIFNKLFNRENAETYRSTEGATAQNLYFIDLLNNQFNYVDTGSQKLKVIESVFESYKDANDVIYKINKGKSKIIYAGGIENTLERTRVFLRYIKENTNSFKPMNVEIAEQIREFVHDSYELADAICYGVAFHFGNLPQSIRDLIEYHFKIGNIDYLFCTSTLLEGVNLPARSVFILTPKKGSSYFETVDFWNLAGRAGRLAMELAGDIFCIKDDNKTWTKNAVSKLILSDKDDIQLTPSFYIDDVNKIEDLKSIIDTGSTDKIKNAEFLRTLGDMIRIDTMRIGKENNLPLINYFRNNGNNDIVSCAMNSTANIKVPLNILLANSHIAINSQHNAFNQISNYSINELKLQWKPTNEEIKSKLNLIFEIYQIDKYSTGKDRLNSNAIPYYAVILSQWMYGNSLSEIIAGAINYYKYNNKDIYIKGKLEPFDTNNSSHITTLVNSTIKDIELKVGYQLQNYISHYCQLLTHVLHSNPGANWSQFIEFGSNDPIVWHLQLMGFSRDCAVFLKRNYAKHLKLESESNILHVIDREIIKNSVKNSKLYALEIKALL